MHTKKKYIKKRAILQITYINKPAKPLLSLTHTLTHTYIMMIIAMLIITAITAIIIMILTEK